MDLYCGMLFQNNWVSCGWWGWGWGSIVESFFSEPFFSGWKKWSKKNHDYIIYLSFYVHTCPSQPKQQQQQQQQQKKRCSNPCVSLFEGKSFLINWYVWVLKGKSIETWFKWIESKLISIESFLINRFVWGLKGKSIESGLMSIEILT